MIRTALHKISHVAYKGTQSSTSQNLLTIYWMLAIPSIRGAFRPLPRQDTRERARSPSPACHLVHHFWINDAALRLVSPDYVRTANVERWGIPNADHVPVTERCIGIVEFCPPHTTNQH